MIGSPPSISMNPNFVIVCISYNMSCVKYYAGSLVKNVPGYQLGLWNNFIWNNCRWIISSRGWSTILHVRILKLWCSPSTYPGIIRFWFHIDFKWSKIQLYRTILRMFHFFHIFPLCVPYSLHFLPKNSQWPECEWVGKGKCLVFIGFSCFSSFWASLVVVALMGMSGKRKCFVFIFGNSFHFLG